MMTYHVDISNPEVFKLVKSAFPSYSGRKVKILTADRVTLDNRFWDGGTKSEWRALNLATLEVSAPHVSGFENPVQFGGPARDPVVVLSYNAALVEHSFFCGKDMGITIYLHPQNFNSALLPVKPELDLLEREVLKIFVALKSSYRGEALRRVAGWEGVVAGLISKGLLKRNKADAISITLEGKNAIS